MNPNQSPATEQAMRLTLRICFYCNETPTNPQVRSFDSFPVILGRSSACDYCLTDASQYVSSNHAVILRNDGQLLIKDTSSNGVYVNGIAEPVGREHTLVLNNEDTLAIGDYTLSVAIERTAASTPANGMDDPSVTVANSTVGQGMDSIPDPFMDDWLPPSQQAEEPSAEEWNINELPVPGSGQPPPPEPDDWDDWPDEFGDPRPLPVNPPPAANRPVIPPSEENRPVKPAAREALESTGSAVPLGALLRAASLRESDFAHLDSTQVLAQTGRLLAQMVDAMMVLLKSRAELKNFVHADVTTLSRIDNNPLKFSVSAADALSKLLANDTDGYLQSDRAVQEAVEDLKLHQLAMLQGMKLAVRSLLLQFDPDKLARTLEKTGGITANIPITREAKLWEMFCEQYDAIREEAINDFGELFGAEFRKAYEKSIRKTGRRPDF